MSRIISIANSKGGCGKSTSAINLGVGLVKEGKRVLLIDSDPQGHAGIGLGFDKNERISLKTMMENIILGLEFDPREAVRTHEEGIDIVLSNKLLAGMEMTLITVDDREHVLSEYLELLKDDYDYIIIDCPPSLNMLTINALTASDSVLITVQPELFSAEAISELLKVYNGVKKNFNPRIEIEGILFTMDHRTYSTARDIRESVISAYGDSLNIYDFTIPHLQAFPKVARDGVSIFRYYNRGGGAESYARLAKEVAGHA